MICKICKKDFKKVRWNQKYCSIECAKEKNRLFILNKLVIPCVICGFDKLTQAHHIIKRQNYGSNNPTNIVQLCPNHHQMADSLRYGEEMLKLIFEKTGKKGELLSKEQIEAIEEYIADRVGGFEYRNHYCWQSRKMLLINGGIFYQIANSVVKDKHPDNHLQVNETLIKG